ncbi:septal ring lytic transglycosylase RlpA family protein [Micromonospora sp. NPDC048871]|uniref:septal ring lytic transglycosylase RlpA family protein n=1 Tax=Micromonospora sp. NPDC048871 TaxID=3364259 RepID=UPI003710F27F
MTAKHPRTRRITSPAGLAASAVVAVALAVGGTVGAVRLTAGSEPVAIDLPPTPAASAVASGSPSPSASASPTVTASPTPSRTAQAPSRSKPRTPKATSTAKPTPTAKKTTAQPVVETGSCGASFYWQGQMTANGETFNPAELTAAHKTLPFNSKVRVTNPANGKSVTVRINDRGPFIAGRCLDLSRAAFAQIASLDLGHIEVRYEVLG